MSEGLLYNTAATSMTMLSEPELLAKAMDFDASAITELYDRYESKVYSYIYRRTGEPALAEDLTAQVFLKMLEAIRGKCVAQFVLGLALSDCTQHGD